MTKELNQVNQFSHQENWGEDGLAHFVFSFFKTSLIGQSVYLLTYLFLFWQIKSSTHHPERGKMGGIFN